MCVLRLPGVFAPHPETDLLAAALGDERDEQLGSALDLCTGTGVLALELARLGAGAVTAVDISARAVLNVRLNARVRGLRVRALRGDLFAPLGDERFDLITANPPYVPSLTAALPDRGPQRAWDAGLDGRALLDRICAEAPARLRPGGRLLLTHSSVADAESTCAALEAGGLSVEIVARRREALGPIMAARVELFEDRGLLAPGTRHEQLVVIRAQAPAARAPHRIPALAGQAR